MTMNFLRKLSNIGGKKDKATASKASAGAAGTTPSLLRRLSTDVGAKAAAAGKRVGGRFKRAVKLESMVAKSFSPPEGGRHFQLKSTLEGEGLTQTLHGSVCSAAPQPPRGV